ncbi:MAG: radical SAM protein [Oscillospiraceae bacterium]|nr:radical SAM protein [Oscillospiraceae bacterium]
MKRNGIFLNDRLRISLTDNCNFKCKYCSNEGQKHNTNSFIDVDFLTNFFDKIVLENIYLKKINLTGGEPLLHKEVLKIVSKASKVCENITINTNGSLLTKQLVDDLINSGVTCIKFGVDNPFSEFSKPIINDVKIHCEELREIILYTVKKIPRSSLNIVVTRYNISDLHNIIKWIIDNSINNVEFIELIDFNFETRTPLIGDEPYNFIDLIRSLDTYFYDIKYNENLAKYIAYHSSGLIMQFAEDFCKHRVCANLWTRVDSNGCFSPCLKSNDSYPIDLNDNLTKQLLNQKRLYCNSLSNYIPRDANGNIASYLQKNIRNPEEYLTKSFTDLDI